MQSMKGVRRPGRASTVRTVLALYFTLLVSEGPEEASGRFTDYRLPADYEKRDRPAGVDSSKPLDVILKIVILDISRVHEEASEMEFDVIVSRSWVEDRMEFTASVPSNAKYALNPVDASKFWIPEFYIQRMTDFSTKYGDIDLTLFMVTAGNTVIHTFRAKVVMKCNFSFELYPLDIQECVLDFMSPLKTSKEQSIRWWVEGTKPPVSFHGGSYEKSLPRHHARIVTCPNTFGVTFTWGNPTKVHLCFRAEWLGDVSTLRVRILLYRQLSGYMLETYVPTILFVVMSWGSFLVKPEVVPGRMVLLVTNLLSLVTLFEANRNSAPPSLSVKAIDVWLLSCIVFVFLALLEYAVVLYMLLEKSTARVKNLKLFRPLLPYPLISQKQSSLYKCHKKLRTRLKQIKIKISHFFCLLKPRTSSSWGPLDRASFGLFPLSFLIYNAIYWCIYISKRKSMIEKSMTC